MSSAGAMSQHEWRPRTSGGAVNALALVARHPEQVRVLVAHEPPAARELLDREQALAACEGIKETYQREGFGPGMAKFIALVSYQGPIPAGFADQPGPDPATFGLPSVDDGSRDDALLGLNMPSCPGYQHDFDALRAASTRVVIGVGAQSAEMMAGRAGHPFSPAVPIGTGRRCPRRCARRRCCGGRRAGSRRGAAQDGPMRALPGPGR
jgi:pimeloyl-ACP methyl ester carboxylesterase